MTLSAPGRDAPRPWRQVGAGFGRNARMGPGVRSVMTARHGSGTRLGWSSSFSDRSCATSDSAMPPCGWRRMAPCIVGVRAVVTGRERTFTVAGHHYALVVLTGVRGRLVDRLRAFGIATRWLRPKIEADVEATP